MGRKFGFSFSWKRALGISSARQRIARATGIPTTKEGRRRRFGPFGLWLLFGGARSAQPQPQRTSLPSPPAPHAESSGAGKLIVLLVLVVCFFAWVIGQNDGKPAANVAPQPQPRDVRTPNPAEQAPVKSAAAAPGIPAESHAVTSPGAPETAPPSARSNADDSADEKMAEYEAAKAEYHAAEKLRLARKLKTLALQADDRGEWQKAARLSSSVEGWYRSIIRFYPETVAAADAAKLLEGEDVSERPVPTRPTLPDGIQAKTGDLVARAAAEAAGDRAGTTSGGDESYWGPAGIRTSGRSKTVYVRSYIRKDGTVVQAHTRSAPGSGGGRRR